MMFTNCTVAMVSILSMAGLMLSGVAWMIYDEMWGPSAKINKQWDEIVRRGDRR